MGRLRNIAQKYLRRRKRGGQKNQTFRHGAKGHGLFAILLLKKIIPAKRGITSGFFDLFYFWLNVSTTTYPKKNNQQTEIHFTPPPIIGGKNLHRGTPSFNLFYPEGLSTVNRSVSLAKSSA
jgi:hypothetical protein